MGAHLPTALSRTPALPCNRVRRAQEGPPRGRDAPSPHPIPVKAKVSRALFVLCNHVWFVVGVLNFAFLSLLPCSRVCAVAERSSGCILNEVSKSLPSSASARFYLLWKISNDPIKAN